MNNDRNGLVLTIDGDFTFTTVVSEVETYSVNVDSQPSGFTCSVYGGNSGNNDGSGTMGDAPDNSIFVECTDLIFANGFE